jgi:metal-responsive CopG/Arc/MetJ family transcriptional regulator
MTKRGRPKNKRATTRVQTMIYTDLLVRFDTMIGQTNGKYNRSTAINALIEEFLDVYEYEPRGKEEDTQ